MEETNNQPNDPRPGEASEVTAEQKKLRKEEVWWFQYSHNFQDPERKYSPLTTREETDQAVDDGYIFSAKEQEAAELMSPKQTEWRRKDIKCVGWSDGSVFIDTIKGGIESVRADITYNAKLTEQKEEILEREKYLLKGEQLTEEDKRIMAIPFKAAKSEKDMIAKNYNKAFKAEFAKARENWVNKIFKRPRQKNVTMPGADAETQAKIMGSWKF